ncbi:hypothetical protein AXE80_10770 [Wenyingzhuangia fucanilytica]|uniref:Uncharacterized protein n=1 Tax=Wenyingzhuangia fucanilytica TaxID=1790137 RepID=A0A1B1Y7I7_9FLAO|nr:hypothetical protein [Wenyingzhuangia fucanilytica]ANW96726.1 hypothetical protein AXE80_10770 [Wenyingzhuangia fucanilytica]
MKTDLPQQYLDLIGTVQRFKGYLFSYKILKKNYEDYNVLDWRWGSAKVYDTKTNREKHPTVEFLLKNDSMKKSQWSKGFPVREIELKEECYKTGKDCEYNCIGLCKESV